jgi:hypothetical protein
MNTSHLDCAAAGSRQALSYRRQQNLEIARARLLLLGLVLGNPCLHKFCKQAFG